MRRFALTLITVLATIALAAPAHAAFPGNNGKIAFRDAVFGNPGEIYSVNPDGSNRTNLTNNPADDGIPAWSPDGTKLAFYSNRDGDNDIYTMNADGTGVTKLTNDSFDDREPAWSPDGTKLAFSSWRPGQRFHVYVMNADGSGQLNLTSEEPLVDHLEPSWSPDGSKISYACCSFGYPNVWLMNVDGTGKTRLTFPGYPHAQFGADWSPDGTRIAYSGGTDTTAEGDFVWYLHVMNADGSGDETLIYTDDFPPDPAWSPNGRKIAITGIAMVDPDGSNYTPVSSGSGLDIRPTWQPLLHDHPQSASTLHVSLVPALRQTISATQCQARGGTPSTHGSPLSFTSCNPPGYLPNTAARLGPGASGHVQLTVVPGNLSTSVDEADVTVVGNLSDVRNRQSGADYNPVPIGGDITLHPLLRVSDTDNGSPATSPATTSDFGIPVLAPCAPTANPALGSTCSFGFSLDATTAGGIKEGRKAAITVWRTWLYDAGSNATPGDSDDRQFAQQGIYIP